MKEKLKRVNILPLDAKLKIESLKEHCRQIKIEKEKNINTNNINPDQSA